MDYTVSAVEDEKVLRKMTKERVIEALKLGIRDYIIKPLSSKSFEGKVKSLLKI
jgi:response regulator of citrate/malate metabolism